MEVRCKKHGVLYMRGADCYDCERNDLIADGRAAMLEEICAWLENPTDYCGSLTIEVVNGFMHAAHSLRAKFGKAPHK